MAPFHGHFLQPRWNWGRWRLRQRHVDQLLNGTSGMGKIDVESAEKHKCKPELHEHDRGQRISALPRPNDLLALRVGGHLSPLTT